MSSAPGRGRRDGGSGGRRGQGPEERGSHGPEERGGHGPEGRRGQDPGRRRGDGPAERRSQGPVERRDEGPGEGWHPLAERVAGQAQDFVDGITALASGQGGDETVPMLLLEVSQILLAGAQLGASQDVIPPGNWEPDVGDDPDLDTVRAGLAKRLGNVDVFAELFDPYADTRPTAFRLSDDLAAIAADLIHGLQHYQAERPLEALWWWQYSYVSHWGTHGGAALRALHSIVAHASLDVAEERVR